jgi:uncharacterized protein YggE
MRRLAVWFPIAMLALQVASVPARADTTDQHTMTVTSTSEIRAVPDRAVVQLGVDTRGDTAQIAMARNNELMNQIVEAIKKLGVPEDDLQTSYINLNPLYSNPPPRDPPLQPQLIGFQASNVLAIELRDLTKVGPVVDASVTNGANQIQGISFRLADELPFKLQALRQAGVRARAKADAMAAGLGVAIDHVDTVTENDYQVVPVGVGAAPAPAVADGKSTPVLPGELIVRAQIQVRFVIK